MRLKFTGKNQESEHVWSYYFEPLEPVEWVAGQSIRLEIPKSSWGYDERRFTIASAPYKKNLRIITRSSGSSFKTNLHALGNGDVVNAYNIEGEFVWQHGSMPKVFLAAGIGITPFLAMLEQSQHEGLKLNTTLIYSSSDNPVPLLGELQDMAAKDDSLEIINPNHRIRIDSKSPFRSLRKNSLVYISGPEAMVKDLKRDLLKSGLPETQLKTDLFTGRIEV